MHIDIDYTGFISLSSVFTIGRVYDDASLFPSIDENIQPKPKKNAHSVERRTYSGVYQLDRRSGNDFNLRWAKCEISGDNNFLQKMVNRIKSRVTWRMLIFV